jgi:hypothetical protein
MVLLTSCQSYEFVRVVPEFVAQTRDSRVIATKQLKPNMMLLVDNSGSMLEPTDLTDPDCMVVNAQQMTVMCGTSAPCPASCATRSSELKSALGQFLGTSSTFARFGLTIFPVQGTNVNGLLGCDGSSSVSVDLPAPTALDTGTEATLTTTSQRIDTVIQNLLPLGGTPTAASLEFLSTYAGLNESRMERDDYRDDFVLLLTDGLPNCNGANANAVCSGPVAACECTTKACSGDPVTGTCSKGCLDRDNTVEKVKALRQRNIKTLVVGFGAELATGNAPQVLNAMAVEGGLPRACPGMTDLECGGAQGSCNTTTKLCSKSFYEASTGAELEDALGLIKVVVIPRPCEFLLSAKPSDRRYLSVLVDGQHQTEGATYSYDYDSNRVTFLGDVCRRLQESTPQDSVSLEFRIVDRF